MAVTCGSQFRDVDVVAEAEGEVLVVESGGEDDGIYEHALSQSVRDAHPATELEGLVVASVAAEQEFEAGAGVQFERRALRHGDDAGHEADAVSNHKLTTGMADEAAVEVINYAVVGIERLVGAIEVVESGTEVEVVVFVEDGEPQHAGGHIGEDEVVEEGFIFEGGEGGVVAPFAIVLQRPAQAQEVEAALGDASFGTYDQVVCFVAIATHFFAVGEGQFAGEGFEFGFAGFIAPEGSSYAEVVVATDGQALVVRSGIGIVGEGFQHAGPLVSVIGGEAHVAVHHARHGGIEVQR